ncbi:MAG: M28 family peptidase [Methylomicrobium sp.]|nr:M28 family peptidase [Methylomicrobium sp.]
MIIRPMILSAALAALFATSVKANDARQAFSSVDLDMTEQRLKEHLKALTVTIGERSVRFPEHLEKTATYIESFYRGLGMTAEREPYDYRDMTVANVIARLEPEKKSARHYLIGAHYDSVTGTVGADDNASAIAVQLETARQLLALSKQGRLDTAVSFVSFALEEPPVFGTRYMGSRVHARRAREAGQNIDGMLCLEMVGYTCHEPSCQRYPFPLMFLGYPKQGDFIGIVGNFSSLPLTRSLHRSFQQNPNLPVVKITVPLSGRIMPAVRLSDHASFWDEGYRAVMITDTAFYRNPHYHRSTDTMETLDYRFMAELVQSLVNFFADRQTE